MRFNKKDREFAAESADHHRENLRLARSRKWREEYSLGLTPCTICVAHTWCPGCPLNKLKQDCNKYGSLYDLITRIFLQTMYPKPKTKKRELIHAFNDMVRVLDLIATGSCTIAQAKPTEMKR